MRHSIGMHCSCIRVHVKEPSRRGSRPLCPRRSTKDSLASDVYASTSQSSSSSTLPTSPTTFCPCTAAVAGTCGVTGRLGPLLGVTAPLPGKLNVCEYPLLLPAVVLFPHAPLPVPPPEPPTAAAAEVEVEVEGARILARPPNEPDGLVMVDTTELSGGVGTRVSIRRRMRTERCGSTSTSSVLIR